MLVWKLFIAYAITCLKKMQIAIFNGVSYYYYACDSECVYDVHEYGNQAEIDFSCQNLKEENIVNGHIYNMWIYVNIMHFNTHLDLLFFIWHQNSIINVCLTERSRGVKYVS